MKKYTFKPITFNNTFRTNNINTETENWSEILDNIIATNIKDNNKYLFTRKRNAIDYAIEKAFGSYHIDDDFKKASDFLANYEPSCNKFKYNTLYKINGTSIIFYDDEIQIGSNLYRYSDFNDFNWLNSLTSETKKIIINIYTNRNLTINIK